MSDDRTSPVCYGAEADDVYMGYAPRDEIVAALNELLEAERACWQERHAPAASKKPAAKSGSDNGFLPR